MGRGETGVPRLAEHLRPHREAAGSRAHRGEISRGQRGARSPQGRPRTQEAARRSTLKEPASSARGPRG